MIFLAPCRSDVVEAARALVQAHGRALSEEHRLSVAESGLLRLGSTLALLSSLLVVCASMSEPFVGSRRLPAKQRKIL